MRRTVVFFNACSASCIYQKADLVTHFEHSFRTDPDMPDFAAKQFYRILDFKYAVFCANAAGIADLPAHCRVKRRLCHNDRAALAV